MGTMNKLSSVQSCLTLWDPKDCRGPCTGQQARLPCPSPTPRAYSNSCPLSQWCLLTISSCFMPFSSHLQSFPTSGSFLVSQLFTSGAKVLDFQLQHQSFQRIFRFHFFRIDWFDLLAAQGTLKSLLQHDSSKASMLRCSVIIIVQLLHPYMTTRKPIALIRPICVG